MKEKEYKTTRKEGGGGVGAKTRGKIPAIEKAESGGCIQCLTEEERGQNASGEEGKG